MNSQSLSNGYLQRRFEKEAKPMKAHLVKKNGWEAGSVENPSRDLFVYLTTCHIGHQVEVHLKDGSVYSGIFHAADMENNFGIILKMACLIKEGIKSRSSLVSKPPSKTFIIPGDELVQVIAKDLPVYSDNGSSSVQSENPLELLTDSSISQAYHVDLERELKPWVPDEEVPDCSDLENVFDDPWKRGWNQFEVNKTLFGVTSTFDEELYTTKLERGPRTRELEEQALRIAREIEGENTRDLHVAEERGLELSGNLDIDEETKYSSVCPANRFDDTGYEEEEDEEEDILLNCCNNLTFGDPSASTGKVYEESWGNSLPSRNNTTVDQNTNKNSSTDGRQAGLFPDRPKSESSSGWPGSSNSAASSLTNRPALSPSSSIGSPSSEKSTLNPNAKEFKLNPNAKSFKPSPTATRPQSPVSNGSFYFPPIPIHMMSASFHHGQQQQQQPMMYNNNNTTQFGPNQTYYSPNSPQYPQQQMMVGQQRPVLFMPPTPYQPEMPYKGRDSY